MGNYRSDSNCTYVSDIKPYKLDWHKGNGEGTTEIEFTLDAFFVAILIRV